VLGDQVKASYETMGEKKIVTEMVRPGLSGGFDPLSSMQSPD
jgi:hypothetical protein